MMLCEAAVVDEKTITDEGFDVRSCGLPAVKIMRLTAGPQAGEEHPACQRHFEEMAKDFSDCFEIVKEFGNVA
jgi:hypothetical protein